MSSTPPPSPSRPLRGPGLFLVAMLASLGVGALIGTGAALLKGLGGPMTMIGTVLIALIGIGLSLAICVWWWRKIDEAAREAHKWAWLWGGCGGLCVGLACMFVLIQIERSDSVAHTMTGSPMDFMIAGMVIILGFEIVGYTLAWAWWWLRYR